MTSANICTPKPILPIPNLSIRDDNDDDEDEQIRGIKFINYKDESQLAALMSLVGRDLSEPYSIFTYRYFLHQWPDLCILAIPTTTPASSSTPSSSSNNGTSTPTPVGCVVCKIDDDDTKKTGYMAMLAVEESYRKSGIGTELVRRAVRRMRAKGCTSVILETEVNNKAAMRLYEERLGFVREELLVRYYLNWGDAYRLRLWFDDEQQTTRKKKQGRL